MNFKEFVQNLRNDEEVEIRQINIDEKLHPIIHILWFEVSLILKTYLFGALNMENSDTLDDYHRNILYSLRNEYEYRLKCPKYPAIVMNYGVDSKRFPYFLSHKHFSSKEQAQKYYDDGSEENILREQSPNGLLMEVLGLCEYPELLQKIDPSNSSQTAIYTGEGIGCASGYEDNKK